MIRLLIYCIYFGITQQICGQCPTSAKITDTIASLKNSSFQDQIKTLKSIELICRQCSIKYDTSYYNLLQKIGAIYYNLDSFSLAEEFTARSIEGYWKKYPILNNERLVKSFLNLGMINRAGNSYDKAFASFDSCLYYAIKYELDSYQMHCYKNLGDLYNYKGDFQQSIFHFERAEQIARKMKDTIFEAIFMGEKALSLLDMKLPEKALAASNRAFKLFFSSIAEKDPIHEAFIYSMFAEVIRSSEGPLRAIDYYKKALKIYTALDERHQQFICLNNIGDIYFDDQKNVDLSRYYFREALKYAKNAYDSALAYSNEGEVISSGNNHTTALQLYQKALMILPSKFKNADPNENPLFKNLTSMPRKESMVIVLIDKASTRMKQYKQSGNSVFLDKAMECFLLADSLIDNMLFEQEVIASKVVWRAKTHMLYESAIEVCLLKNNLSGAFYFFEKSRSFVLNEQIRESIWLMRKNNQILSLQTRAKKEIINLEYNLKNEELKEGERHIMENSLFQLRKYNDSLTNLIKHVSKAYTSTVPSLTKIQNKLGNQFGLFEFFIGDSAVYTFYLDSRKVRLNKINRVSFDQLVSSFTDFCQTEGAINNNYSSFVKVSMDLYHLLFDQSMNVSRLIISPDGQFFPFEALVVGNNSGGIDHLISKYAISYIYSASSLLDVKINQDIKTSNFLGFAPVAYDHFANLERLSKSDESLKAISKKFTMSTVHTSLSATKNCFLESFNKYKVIQLYTHAAGKSENNEPVIYFSDSCVYLSELLVDKPIATKLIFLSGCETGSGKHFRGEGVFSLGRGFTVLGIPSTITTLWKVENQSMYSITELFYQHLADGLPTDIALQKAKLEFMSRDKHNSLPYYWAAPVLIGNTDPLMSPDKNQNIWLLLLSILAAAFIAFIAVKQLKKRA